MKVQLVTIPCLSVGVIVEVSSEELYYLTLWWGGVGTDMMQVAPFFDSQKKEITGRKRNRIVSFIQGEWKKGNVLRVQNPGEEVSPAHSNTKQKTKKHGQRKPKK